MIAQGFTENQYLELTGLATATYPGGELTNPDFLRWEYEKNPAGPAILSLDKSESTLNAQYVVLPWRFRMYGHETAGSLSLNTMTHPDARGRGLFKQLAMRTYDELESMGVGFTVGFPNRNSAPGFQRSLGFTTLGALPFLIRPLRWMSVMRRFITGSAERKGSSLELAVNPASVFRSKEWCVSVVNASFWDHRWDDFLQSFYSDKRIVSVRDASFMDWRYNQCPTRNYRVLVVTDNSESTVHGFVVLGAQELMGLKCGVLVDFGMRNEVGSENAFGFLLHVAAHRMKAGRMDAIVSACNASCLEYGMIKRSGFIRIPERLLPQPLNFIYRRHGKEASRSAIPPFSDWFLTFGDYDVL